MNLHSHPEPIFHAFLRTCELTTAVALNRAEVAETMLDLLVCLVD
jgi:hypothetical protein